ncbi:MAG: RNA polymerase factor sigma-54 [Candidatus Eisenbacteria sp.]|nr:RNA polymerase factor sigma-54 [Candidatus Eisenbacteria bacterium]
MPHLRTDLVVAPRGQLILTPQMRLALEILQAPTIELGYRMRAAVTENPFLEEDSGGEFPPGEVGERPASGDALGRDRSEHGAASAGEDLGAVASRRWEWDDSNWVDRIPDGKGAWQEKILRQYRLRERSSERIGIAEVLLGGLDERGYLAMPVEEIARLAGTRPARVESVRRELLQLDPAGIGARDLGECLAAQLAERGSAGGLAARIARRDLGLLARRRYARIARRYRVTVAEVERAGEQIRELHPCPAGLIQRKEVQAIYPDLVVEKVAGTYEVLMNDRFLPQVRLVPPGGAVTRARDPEVRGFVAEHLTRARWLLGSLDARRRTLVRLMRLVIEEQREYFERGVSALHPLSYQRMAARMGLHESTVARAVRGKYVQTPRGLLPLRYFFASGVPALRGDPWTPAAIEDRIRRLVAHESRTAPLSDQALTQRLRGEGPRIARRTVAKYRDRLGIPKAAYRRGI